MTHQNQAPAPSVDDLLEAAHAGCGVYEWNVEGGRIQIEREKLLQALNAHYDASNPNWPVFVTYDLQDEA